MKEDEGREGRREGGRMKYVLVGRIFVYVLGFGHQILVSKIGTHQ